MKIALTFYALAAIVGTFITFQISGASARYLKSIEAAAIAGNKARLDDAAALKAFQDADAKRERERQFANFIGRK